jgi:radical SAM protein with 4Fe4S-binding SPASM domain
MSVSVELTTFCNMNCPICARKDMALEPKHMSLEQLQQTIHRLRDFVTMQDSISVVGFGEPLLYPYLKEALTILHSTFPENPVYVNTNALLLNECGGMLVEAMTPGDTLVFSVNASNPEAYEKYMGSSCFHYVCNGINKFLNSYQKRPRVYLRYLQVPENNLAEFEKLWPTSITISEHPLLHWRSEQPLIEDRIPCPSILGGIHVDVDGDVYPCCKPYVTRRESSLWFGNIMDSDLKETYVKKVEELRSMHVREIYPRECLFCDFWTEYRET